MTVKELKEKLNDFDDNREIVIRDKESKSEFRLKDVFKYINNENIYIEI